MAAGKTCGTLILAAFIPHAVCSLGYLFNPIAFLQIDFRYFRRIGSYKACQESFCLVLVCPKFALLVKYLQKLASVCCRACVQCSQNAFALTTPLPLTEDLSDGSKTLDEMGSPLHDPPFPSPSLAFLASRCSCLAMFLPRDVLTRMARFYV